MDFNDRRAPSDGFAHHPETDPKVRALLDTHLAARKRGAGVRMRFHYGEPSTGKAWGDSETGYVGSSMGPQKIPLVISSARSMGGGALLTHKIVKVEAAKKNRDGSRSVLYKHPNFKE